MSKKGGGRPRRPRWWRPAGRSDTDCTAKGYRLINDRSAPCGTCTHTLSLLYLSPTPPRAGGRTRSGSAKTGEEVTQRQPRLVLSVWFLQVQVMRAAGRRQGFWFKARIIGIRKYAASRPAAAVSPESLWLAVSEPVRQHRSVVMVKAVYCRWEVLLCLLACFLLVKKPGNRFCVCAREMS